MNSIHVGHIVSLAGVTLALHLFLWKLLRSRPVVSPLDSQSKPSPETTGVRLCQVYPPPESETVTDVDVIAIHGLDTDSARTWTWKHERPEQDVNWLNHPDMLPKRIPNARIFTCDWPAHLFEQSDFVQKKIEEFARLLLAGIKDRPQVTNENGGNDNRPIVFIASCFGGIVLMKALTMANEDYSTVEKGTCGIIFLATPFWGTSFENVAKWADPELRYWATIQGKIVTNLRQYMTPNFDLREIRRNFHTFCEHNRLIKNVFIFYETGKTSLPHKIFPWLPAFWSQKQPLVNQDSATLDFVEDPLPLDRPHIQMNKFKNPDDPGYISVAAAVANLLENVLKGEPIEIAKRWILDTCYSRGRLAIERLSGDRLPMDRCYINLAIVTERASEVDGLMEKDTQSSPFSLHARWNNDRPQKGAEITLQTLFESHDTRRGHTRPSRILIRGRAGVGKTTLCKKIIYEFTYGTLWQDLFDWVLWVPLRNLKLKGRSNIPGYNVEYLFRHEFFSHHSMCNQLSKALSDELFKRKGNKILFILDGLDEVSQDLHGDMFRFLEELLNQSNVIITSRPNATLPANVEHLDLELETIGFYPDQVKAYIENTFSGLETSKPNSNKIDEVQSFINRHQPVQDLVRIPIQLDAFCYIWDDSIASGEDAPETMTGIYRRIEQSLWRKDAEKIGKYNQQQVKAACPDNIKVATEAEHSLLEACAFTGMYNDVIDFQPKHRAAISSHFNRSNNILLDWMLGQVSFLRLSDLSANSTNRNYHFLHLTYLEYLAAQYFVRHWTDRKRLECLVLDSEKSEKVEPAAFLQRHKYNTHYEIFWRFVVGSLDTEQMAFFQTIQENRDLLGPVHRRLMMGCLSEVPTKAPLRQSLVDQLSQWILFEFSFRRDSKLIDETDIPVDILEKVFKQLPNEGHPDFIECIGRKSLLSKLSDDLVQMVAAHLKDESREVRRSAIQTLIGQTITKRQFQAIIERFQDEDEHHAVRTTAMEHLRSRLPEEDKFEAIAEYLGYDKKFVQEETVGMLKDWPLTTKQLDVIATHLKSPNMRAKPFAMQAINGRLAIEGQVIVECLEHKDWGVREAALKVLCDQELAHEQLQAVVACLEDENIFVRLSATDVLMYQQVIQKQLQVLPSLLKDENEEGFIRINGLKILERRPVTEEQLKIIKTGLGDGAFRAINDAIGNVGEYPVTWKQIRATTTPFEYHDLSTLPPELRWALMTDPIPQRTVSEYPRRGPQDPVEQPQDTRTRNIVAKAHKSHSVLSEEILQVVTKCLVHRDEEVRVTALEVLDCRSALQDHTLQAIIASLNNNQSNLVEAKALNLLARQPNLPKELLSALISRLWDRHNDIISLIVLDQRALSLIPEHHVRDFYKVLLEQSMREHLSWHVVDGTSYITHGLKEYSEVLPDHLTNAIREAQKELGVPYPTLSADP
ncbi:ARM repeat-containing protein [Xylaria cf. heliscus]|nr:ARM repeat-containing protein [Xylaria cf. heliscus]